MNSYSKDADEKEWQSLEKMPVSVVCYLEEHGFAHTIRVDHLDRQVGHVGISRNSCPDTTTFRGVP